MTENVWTTDPDAQVVDDVERFEIIGEPEPPDERVRDVEFVNRQMDEAAREAAWAHHMQTCTGVWLPLPDLTSWPRRYREAFVAELARLETVTARRA